MEAALDSEIEKAENLDEDDLARIKAKRMAEMKKKALDCPDAIALLMHCRLVLPAPDGSPRSA